MFRTRLKPIAAPTRFRPALGAAWDAEEQLLPVDADEALLEEELDDMPPGLMCASGFVAGSVMVLMAILAEFTVLDAHGFAGPAVFFCGAAVLIGCGIPCRWLGMRTWLLAALLAIVCYRMAVSGTWAQVAIAGWLLAALTLSFRHQTPFFLRTIVFATESCWAGYDYFLTMHKRMSHALALPDDERPPSLALNAGLPALVLLAFAGLAIAIRPEILAPLQMDVASSGMLSSVWQRVDGFNLVHVGVWCLVMWVTIGLLRPVLTPIEDPPCVIDRTDGEEHYHAPMFFPLLNTLVAVVVALSLFLWMEFRNQKTVVPFGLSDSAAYAAYTQEGLSWLALGSVGTIVMLCVIFNSSVLADSRLWIVRALSGLLVGLNLLLAALVVQRFLLHIDYDGLSRLKVLGLLAVGVASGALLLTMLMSLRQQNVVWLLRRKVWLVALAGYVFLVSPVDRLIQIYNVNSILKGNAGPLAQITPAQVDDEAVCVLLPLCEASDPVVRDEAVAVVTHRLQILKTRLESDEPRDWTVGQWGGRESYQSLRQFASSDAGNTLATAPEQVPYPSQQQVQREKSAAFARWW